MRPLILCCLVFLTAVSVAAPGQNAGRYLEVNEYLASAFVDEQPRPGTLWVGGELRATVERMLGHRFAALRVRYWFDGDTSVWVLDEIGKELPITIGVTVRDDRIINVRVLEFRESRGWEVRYPFFTDQFKDITLSADGHLSRNIDGITGATLSVGAVKRVARVALVLHDSVKTKA